MMVDIPMPKVHIINDVEDDVSVDDIVTIFTQMIVSKSVFVSIDTVKDALEIVNKVLATLIVVNDESPEKQRIENLAKDLESRVRIYDRVINDFSHLLEKEDDNA